MNILQLEIDYMLLKLANEYITTLSNEVESIKEEKHEEENYENNK